MIQANEQVAFIVPRRGNQDDGLDDDDADKYGQRHAPAQPAFERRQKTDEAKRLLGSNAPKFVN